MCARALPSGVGGDANHLPYSQAQRSTKAVQRLCSKSGFPSQALLKEWPGTSADGLRRNQSRNCSQCSDRQACAKGPMIFDSCGPLRASRRYAPGASQWRWKVNPATSAPAVRSAARSQRCQKRETKTSSSKKATRSQRCGV